MSWSFTRTRWASRTTLRAMRERLVDGLLQSSRLVEGLIQGNQTSWILVAALWLLTAALVAFGRVARGRGIFVLLGATTATSIVAFPLAAAVAVPRLRWKTV